MTRRDKIQLVGGLLDLPILDKDQLYCGIVDDIELDAGNGTLRVKALLVGPGAYRGRLPGWAFRLVCWIAGDSVTRVPWEAVERIGSAAFLNDTADAFGLHAGENRIGRAIPHVGAM